MRYLLGVIIAAYRKFSFRVSLLTNWHPKPDRIHEIIKITSGKITKNEILIKCPDISKITVEWALSDMLEKQKIIKIVDGRYTAYTWNHEKE